MARTLQTLCDFCGAVLYGKDKAAFQKEPFIQIRGQITLENQRDRADDFHYHVFINDKSVTELTFCSGNDYACMISYIASKHEQYKKRGNTNDEYYDESQSTG